MNACPTCGQTLPPASVPELRAQLTPTQRRIFDIVSQAGRHGIPTDALESKLYSFHANGGPDSARKTLHVHVTQLNKRLCPFGKRIRANRSGGHMNGQGICGIYVYEDFAGIAK